MGAETTTRERDAELASLVSAYSHPGVEFKLQNGETVEHAPHDVAAAYCLCALPEREIARILSGLYH